MKKYKFPNRASFDYVYVSNIIEIFGSPEKEISIYKDIILIDNNEEVTNELLNSNNIINYKEELEKYKKSNWLIYKFPENPLGYDYIAFKETNMHLINKFGFILYFIRYYGKYYDCDDVFCGIRQINITS